MKKAVLGTLLLGFFSLNAHAAVMPDEYQCKSAYKVKAAVKANVGKANAEDRKSIKGLDDVYTQVIEACLKANVTPEKPEAGKDYSSLLFESNITGVYFE